MRNRGLYVCWILAVIAAGLLSRQFPALFSKWIGDGLWGLMVFLLAAGILRNKPALIVSAVAALIALGVEFAKLVHTSELDAFRDTTIGGLLLGHGFSWGNTACYLGGIAVGAGAEWLLQKKKNGTQAAE